MSRQRIEIPPRRSMVFFALLAILMTVASYILLVSLAVACVYIPYLAIRETSNIEILLLFLFGIAVAGALLWSLIPKRDNFQPPGPRMERASHPQLFAELDRIAALLDQPLPKDVYLIGELNAWVADRGGVMGFGSHRIIGLGLPLLSVLTIAEFRAVLAHEFAHFYGGDTKLGPWVYKARGAMIQTFENIGSLRTFARVNVLALMYIVLFAILKWYFTAFLRITSFISRRQEFRADELACLVTGTQSLVTGLQTIRSAAPAWLSYWNTEVAPLLAQGTLPVIGDGFARFVAAPSIAPQIRTYLSQQLEIERANPYDTHPPLRKRIRAAEQITRECEQLTPELAISLLGDLEATELGLVKEMTPKLASAPLTRVHWDDMVSKATVPHWIESVERYGKVLEGYTLETLPDAAAMLPQFAHHIRNPKGQLLDMEQRKQRAAELLGVALGLALFRNGWQLQVQPGERYLLHEDEKLNPFRVIGDLASKELTRADWVARCQRLGIGQIRLAPPQKESLPTCSSIT